MNHPIAIVSIAVQLVRSSADEVKRFKVGTVGQRGQERFNRCAFEGNVRSSEIRDPRSKAHVSKKFN